MDIRPAGPADAAGIAHVHVRSWQDAYRGLMPDEHLDTLDVQARHQRWSRILATTDWPRTGAFVAQRADGIVGFVHVGSSRDEDGDRVGEVTAIYVLGRAWGTGAGRGLMAAAVASLTGAGFVEATLWVLDGNLRARRFYESGGWVADGAERTEDWCGFPLREVRYRRPLGARYDDPPT